MKNTQFYAEAKAINTKDIEDTIVFYELELLNNQAPSKRRTLKTAIKGLRALRELSHGIDPDRVAANYLVERSYLAQFVGSAKKRVGLIMKLKQKQQGVEA